MKKLSEYKNEEALDLLSDILEPSAKIMADNEIVDEITDGNKLKGVSAMIKKYKKEVLQIMAILEGVPVEEYQCNVFTLPMILLEIVNDPEVLAFFTAQQTLSLEQTFGSAMGITQEPKE